MSTVRTVTRILDTMAGEHLDLSSGSSPGNHQNGGDGKGRFIGVNFACCEVYARIYINRERTGYEGRCPKCLRTITFSIGPGGTDQRVFTVY